MTNNLQISPNISGRGNLNSNIEDPIADALIEIGTQGRELAIYPARSGYELERELEFLSNRAMEQNIFFSGSFLAPAMPRLDNRPVQLMVIRDRNEKRSRLRFLLPFSIENPGFGIGAPIIRVWSNDFGPLGTPLVDSENALETIDNFIEGMGNEKLKMPQVMVFPDIRLDSSFAQMLRGVALSKNLPLMETNEYERPMLESDIDAPDYLPTTISKHHVRELNRQRRRLADNGTLEFVVARQPNKIRESLEEFLHLENKGWKGRKKTSLVADRHRAAFAREAINNLADLDRVRIHYLSLNGQVIASLIVFIMGGDAYTWKTAFDEDYAAYSPGKLLMQETTEWQLDDFNIIKTDSCAKPDHPIMARFWQQRCNMGTLVVGLKTNSDRDVRQVTKQLHIYKNSKNMAKKLRDKVRAFAKNK
tara:strand:- start:128 stop:1387 length:1260 start_codon:yes stop_codon:yes gene_type:complete